MKNLFSILLLSAPFLSIAQKDSELCKIRIKYVNPYIESPIRINYQLFDSSFKPSMCKDTVIIDNQLLNSIQKAIGNIRYSRKNRQIDVRCKVSLFFIGTDQKSIDVFL